MSEFNRKYVGLVMLGLGIGLSGLNALTLSKPNWYIAILSGALIGHGMFMFLETA